MSARGLQLYDLRCDQQSRFKHFLFGLPNWTSTRQALIESHAQHTLGAEVLSMALKLAKTRQTVANFKTILKPWWRPDGVTATASQIAFNARIDTSQAY